MNARQKGRIKLRQQWGLVFCKENRKKEVEVFFYSGDKEGRKERGKDIKE